MTKAATGARSEGVAGGKARCGDLEEGATSGFHPTHLCRTERISLS